MDQAPPAVDVRELADRLEIADLYVRYALALDEQDLDLLAAVFAPDVKFKCGIPGVPYREGIKANQDRLLERHRKEDFRERHLTAPPVIRSLTPTRAETSAEAVIVKRKAGGEPHIEAMGRYNDVLEKRDGRWVFVARAFHADK